MIIIYNSDCQNDKRLKQNDKRNKINDKNLKKVLTFK